MTVFEEILSSFNQKQSQHPRKSVFSGGVFGEAAAEEHGTLETWHAKSGTGSSTPRSSEPTIFKIGTQRKRRGRISRASGWPRMGQARCRFVVGINAHLYYHNDKRTPTTTAATATAASGSGGSASDSQQWGASGGGGETHCDGCRRRRRRRRGRRQVLELGDDWTDGSCAPSTLSEPTVPARVPQVRARHLPLQEA